MRKSPTQITLAHELRQSQTDAEKALWARLRNKQLEGVKFRRQQPLGRYIVDFISFERKIIVEVNGGQHNEPSPFEGEGISSPSPGGRELEGGGFSMRERDEERTAWLKHRGYRVLRFWNNDVLMNMEGVLERMKEALG